MGYLSQSQRAKFLRQRAALAVTQSRIHTLFQRVLSWNLKRNDSDGQAAIKAINEELDALKYSLPEDTQPVSQRNGSPPLEMPLAMLHFIYYSCVCKVSMAVVLLANLMPSSPEPGGQPANDSDASCSDSTLARVRCATAARAILNVLFKLQP